MPILWRYLILNFLKIVFASVTAFVAILLTMRMDEIAHFAALGAPTIYLLTFVIHQIPYILPIALPLSCLLASLLLIQRMSLTHELTALRASGFSLLDILAPMLITAAFLALANFWITSELATQSHLKTNLLKSELRSINPLFLLHNKHLMRLKGYYFEALGTSHVGESATDVVFGLPNKNEQRIQLMIAKNLKANTTSFDIEGVTFITGAASDEENDFDHLLIENIKSANTPVENFARYLQKKVLTINNDHLQLPLLLARIREQQHSLETANPNDFDKLRMQLNQSLSEIIKRFSISLAVFSFTLMGFSFGLNISRRRRFTPLFAAITLTTLYLIAFFIAKGMEHNLMLATPLFLMPHLIILFATLFVLRRISSGIE